MAISLEEVQALADQLPPLDQAQLIGRLAKRLANGVPSPLTKPRSDAWQRLQALREEFRTMGPGQRSIGEQLEADRAERDAMLLGRSDVHS